MNRFALFPTFLLLGLLVAAGPLLAAPAAKVPVYYWTPAKAAATIKVRYTTADPKAVAIYQANIDQQLAAGKTEADPTVIRLRQLLADAQHMAKVTSASCAGIGKPMRGRYAKFRCRATVTGRPNLPPDYVTFTKNVRLTLTVGRTGYRITVG